MREKLYHAIDMESNSSGKILILLNIRSNENVGAFFRTADAVGIDTIFLVGYTPTPIDRFGREVGAIAKTALGAQRHIPWEKRDEIEPLVHELKSKGVTVVAVEQSSQAVDYKEFPVSGPTACIFGNEVTGIDKHTLDLVDHIIEIPMRGSKESLNVAVAGGVALFRLFDR